MQPIGSMIRRTSHHVTRQRERFALRARRAGSTFAVETRDAGRDLASAVRAEANAWTKYVRETTLALAPVTLERKLLVSVAGALRTAEARVRERLDALDGHGKRRAKRAAPKVSRREASASRPRARAS